MNQKKLIAFILGFSFFLIGLLTLPDYGINWDTINHLPRGQAYLNYFFTGNTDYSNLPEKENYWQDPSTLAIKSDVPNVSRRSLYQLDGVTYNWLLQNDGNGHPPLSDIASSFFNLVFYQKLGVINDIDSYRVYGVFLSAALVGLAFWWVSVETSKFGGLVAALSLALYPLFWSETHFNTEKDIPETVFWSFLLYSVWKGIDTKSYKWILASGVFFGLALGTKFNIIFAVFVVIPWLGYHLARNNYRKKINISKIIRNHKRLILAALSAPIVGFTIFIASWPYLWGDPIDGIAGVVKFYQTLGLTTNFDTRFIGLFGVNTYPAQWVLFTTPVIVLILFIIGIFYILVKVKSDKRNFFMLLLLWFTIPLLRVSLPGANIYGGVRQIMEYIPAMAMIAGVGAHGLRSYLGRYSSSLKSLVGLLILLSFLPHIKRMSDIHPNQTVYFNSLAGGLSGAKDRGLPSWGNSFGAAYRQGVVWLNENAEKDANLVFAFEHIPNIPRILLRQDFVFTNRNRSGYLQNGEYTISLTYDGTDTRSYYDFYLSRFVNPSYQVIVDEVPILKVWHNAPENQKYSLKEEEVEDLSWEETGEGIIFDLGESQYLSRLEYTFDENNCVPVTSAHVSISEDSESWERLYGSLPVDWLIPDPEIGQQPVDGGFHEPFIGQEARYIKVDIDPFNACMRQIKTVKVRVFTDAPWLRE